MGIYGPDITEALEPYATQFDDIKVEERKPIIDLNAINPVSELRSSAQNVTSDQTEHKLSTAANTNETAYLETKQRGQYTAGYEAQAGIGVRTDSDISNNEVRRWGYYTTDSNGDPLDGWYIGEDSNGRRAGHYRDSLSGVDDTQWYPVVSVQIKDGTDIGSIDFSHIIGGVIDFQADTDNTGYRWQVRRGTTPNSPTWETPSTHEDKQDETAMKVDVSSTNIQDGSSNTTGIFVDGGTLSAGGNNPIDIQQEDASGEIVGSEIITVVVQAIPGGSGTITESFVSWEERW
jgi:hypothetical protein